MGTEAATKPVQAGSATRRARTGGSYLLQLLPVLLLAGGFAFYYFGLHVPNQESRLVAHNLRLLADMGDQIHDTIHNLVRSVDTMLESAYKELPTTAGEGKKESDTKRKNEFARHYIEQIRPQPEIVSSLILTNGAVDQETVELSITGDRDKSWVNVKRLKQIDLNTHVRSELKIRVQTHKLLEAILGRSEFDVFVIANERGETIFQSDSAEVRLTHIPAAAIWGGADGGGVPEGKGGSDKGAEAGDSVMGGSSVATVEIAGIGYRAFYQPLHIAFDQTVGNPGATTDRAGNGIHRWMICGLVKQEEFRAQVWSLPHAVQMFLIVALILLVLLWPWLDLVLSDPCKAISRLDLLSVAATGFILFSFMTLVTLYLNAYDKLEDDMDKQLPQLGRQITRNLWEELGKAHDQLVQLDKLQSETNILVTNLLCNPQLKSKELAYPFFDFAFWVRGDGWQVAKWATESQTTPMVRVDKRAYFSQIIHSNGWTLLEAVTNRMASTNGEKLVSRTNAQPFYLDPVFSSTRNLNKAIFSIPSTNKFSITNQAAVLALEFRPISLTDPVLPAGYGFCLIDDTGRVLFHSDARRNLRENFFVECDQEQWIKSAVYGRVAQGKDAYYQRHTHRVYLRPLEGVPWTLVVFRDETLLDSMFEHAALMATAMLVLWWVLALIIWLALRFGIKVWLGSARRANEQGEIILGKGRRWFTRLVGFFAPKLPYLVIGLVVGVGLQTLFGVSLVLLPKRIYFLFALVLLYLFHDCLPFAQHWRRIRGTGLPDWLWKLARLCAIGLAVGVGLQTLYGASVESLKPPLSYILFAPVLYLFHDRLPFAQHWRKTCGAGLTGRLWRLALLCAIGMVALSGVATAAAIWRFCYAKEMDLFIRGFELKWAKDYQSSRDRLARDWHTNPHGGLRLAQRQQQQWDTYFPTNLWGASQTGEVRVAAPEEDAYLRFRPPLRRDDLGNSGLLTNAAVHMNIPGTSFRQADRCWLLAVLVLLFFLLLGAATWYISSRLFLFGRSAPARGPDAPENHNLWRMDATTAVWPADLSPELRAACELFAKQEEGRFDVLDIAANYMAKLPKLLARERLSGAKDCLLLRSESPDERVWSDDLLRKLADLAETQSLTILVHPLSSDRAVSGVFSLPDLQSVWKCSRQAATSALAAHFLALWRECTEDEKLALHQVAKHGIANPRQPAVLPLLRRGLVLAGLPPHVFNPSFVRFALAAFPAEEHALEAVGGFWSRVKTPVLFLSILLAGFLLATQQNLQRFTAMILPALVGAITHFQTILNLFRKKPPGDA